ncbi:ATP-dependent zinc metalloprotease FtsH [Posidoniimonas corsicana]|uniref:ATP-dependent zinc metalloprotease FtsH n=1 Tax=Posidoniimonas corsicana TaxID=1938618 RepID=A0A5C5VJI6_9BACT|nr:ATP-dependent zinc metalloprotease FtsH [Posidoniimonas corsicana]TWT38153.1 ATP-dependent zinc metalloprotease FtsH [Posidoniimonas corsicana]
MADTEPNDKKAATPEERRARGEDPKQPSGKPPRKRPVAPVGWTMLPLLLLVGLLFASNFGDTREQVTYSFLLSQVKQGNVKSASFVGSRLNGEFVVPPPRPAAVAAKPDAQAKTEADKPAPSDGAPSKSTSTDADTKTEADADAPSTDSDDKTTDEAADSEQDAAPTDDPPKQTATPDVGSAGKPPETISKNFYVVLSGNDQVEKELFDLLIANGVVVTNEEEYPIGTLMTFIWFVLLIGMVVLMFSFMRRAREQMMGGGMLGSVTKSPAKRYSAESGPKVTFDDVAGLKGVKTDLKEIVEFLREPEKFQKLGARVPKGVLLNGPPGTGKTLLAKAVAGEAGVPFFSINGSEFIQLFVGVGASRVRDMFKTAKRSAPAILFIDEIDAVGRQRGAGLGGGHDEREQTLNQILSEMDGFTPSETVIVIAATNRPDVLDPALLRPGRFDRHVTVDRPTLEGRKQLFEVHTRNIPLSEDVNFDRLARATVGMTGADIQNLANEAALWATRHNKAFVSMEDFEFARDKIMMGANREDLLSEEEKKVTAYHEAGHTLVAWLLPECDRVHKVTIIPRGRALGVTQMIPDEDRHNVPQSRMHATLAMALAGRAAEKIVYDEFSAGAESDLKRATSLARRMVTHWGMSERLGPVAYSTGEENPFLGREIVQEQRHFSEHTAQVIDEEVSKILHNAADRARTLLTEQRGKLDALTNALLEKEELDEDEISELIGPPAQGDLAPIGASIEIAPPSPTTTSPRDND